MSTENEYEQEPSPEMLTVQPVWEILAKAREEKGLSVEEVARYLKITEGYVLALEQGRYEELPGLTFVRGYIKNYARLLGLESDALIEKLAAEEDIDGLRKPFMEVASKPLLERQASPILRYSLTFGCALVIAFGSYYIWNQNSTQSVIQQESAVLAPLAAPELAVVADAHIAEPALPGEDKSAVEETTGSSHPEEQSSLLLSETEQPPDSVDISLVQPPEMASLYIRFNDDCWMEVRDMSGNILMSGVEKAGTELDTTVPSAVRLRLGNTPGVDEIKFAGRTISMPTGASAKKVAKLALSTSEQS